MDTPADRLAAFGITLPPAAPPVANYVPFVVHQGLITVSGQISMGADGVVTGKLGVDHDLASGQAAAKLCAINLIAQVNAATGGALDRVTRVIKLGGFVNAAPDFSDIPQVVNGASDLIADVFGDRGRHARSAVGCANLPLNAAVEVDGVFAIA